MIKLRIKALILAFLAPFAASATSFFNEIAPASFADTLHSFENTLHLSGSPNAMNYYWLPKLTGLPKKDQVAQLTQNMMSVMMEDTDTACTSVNPHLRMMIFQHFVIYQHMLNAHHVYFDERIAHQWAHVLAMILKESSGDSTNVTGMSGRTVSTNRSETNLQQWKGMFDRIKQSQIHLNYQTNFGLTQTSTDRLFDAFCLTKDQKINTPFLKGQNGAPPGVHQLNTAVAIRRLIWFYQDFAQGRLADSDEPLQPEDITKPEYSAKFQQGLDMAILYCGTGYMFRGKSLGHGVQKTTKLRNALASIAFCKLGNLHTGYGTNEFEEECFAKWVTLCPALNIDIATLTPLSYFATRGATPVCESTFMRLINKMPSGAPGVEGTIEQSPSYIQF